MGRSPCCDESGLKKGPWTPEEDHKLVSYIQNHGHGSWTAFPKLAGTLYIWLNRCGKSCRLRWMNYLRPGIKRGKFSPEEEQKILNLHAVLGNKWSAIASHLPGRTDNEIKNFWNTHLKKQLIQMGYDPMTHQPRTDMFSSLPYLIALANLKNYFDHQPWEQNATKLQAEAVQLARLQCLQHLLKLQASTESEANENSCINSSFRDMDMINLLCFLSSMKNNNLLLSSTHFENTISSLGASNLQFVSDSITYSRMPHLETPCAYELPLCKDMVQAPESIAFCPGESSPDSSWLLSCSSTTPSPSHVAPHVTDNAVNNCCSASAIWPELLLEDPMFHEIAYF